MRLCSPSLARRCGTTSSSAPQLFADYQCSVHGQWHRLTHRSASTQVYGLTNTVPCASCWQIGNYVGNGLWQFSATNNSLIVTSRLDGVQGLLPNSLNKKEQTLAEIPASPEVGDPLNATVVTGEAEFYLASGAAGFKIGNIIMHKNSGKAEQEGSCCQCSRRRSPSRRTRDHACRVDLRHRSR